MNGLSIAAIAALVLTIYGVVVVWYIGSRGKGGDIDERIRTIVQSSKVNRKLPLIDEVSIDIKGRENLSSLQKFEKNFGVDSYEALYYPMPIWMVLLVASLLSVGICLACRVIFSVPEFVSYLVMPFLWLFLCRTIFARLHLRRHNKLFVQLPDTLDFIVRAVRIGVATSEALRSAGRDAPEPTGTEFRKLADALAIGITLPEAMRTMADNNKIAEYRFLAIAIALQASAGGSIGGTLEDVAHVIRSRVSIKVRGRALTGEARASATVLTALPIFTTLAMSVISPKYIMQLFLTRSGLHYFGVAVVLILLGQFTMSGMVRRTLDKVR